MEKITQEMRDKLREPLPKEAVKPHPTKTFLSSIKAIYVTERLNDVFGVGSWQLRLQHITTTDKSMVVVKVEFTIPEYGVYYECFGGNDNGGENSKNFDLGDAYKGATTDALTKIGSYLEIGIDVFKGNNTPPTPPKKLPAISKAQFEQACERIKGGDKMVYQKAVESFTLTAAQVTQLDQLHKSLN